MTLLGFDLNSTRARAVHGPAGDFPLALQLEPPRHDFPLILSWTGNSFDVGSQGLLLCREQPFLICRDFLPYLGENNHFTLRWQLGRHHLDGGQALKLVFQQLRPVTGGSRGVTFALPPYLKLPQIQLLSELAEHLNYPLQGSLPGPLALALSAHAEHGWSGPALVVDLDDHALWLAIVEEADGFAFLQQSRLLPHLGLQRWKNRLLNTLADCCIAATRRDPRANAGSEQALYLQLDGIMEHCVRGQAAPVAFQAANWYQQIMLPPNRIVDFCQPLARQVVSELAPLFNSGHTLRPPTTVLLSSQAAALPGLASALQQFLERWSLFNHREPAAPAISDPEDFGENLLQEEEEESGPRLIQLTADAAARGAHLIAGLFYHGYLSPGHLEDAAPLPEPQPVESGPARLHYQGRDYFLPERPFTLGRAADCDLMFDAEHHPEIAPRHCAVIYDLRRYLVKNLDHHLATWINNQPVEQLAPLSPGDWIRLGLNGPRLRFLGQPDFQAMTTIA